MNDAIRAGGEHFSGWILSLVLLSLLFGCALPREDAPGSSAGASEATPKEYGPNRVISFDLSAGAPESPSAGGFFGIPPERTYMGLLSALKEGLSAKDVGAVYVSLGGASMGFSMAEELGREFGKLRASGKPVFCHTHGIDNSLSSFTSRACDEVWLSPAGSVDTVGLAGQLMFLKGVLDKLGVEADFIHMGKYKSFAEQFTRQSPSPEAREALESVLGSLRASWVGSVKQHRAGAELALEDGPWTPKKAVQRRLIDKVGYDSEALTAAQQRGSATRVQVVFGPGSQGYGSGGSLAALIRSVAGANRSNIGTQRIAVVTALGGIAMSSGGFGGGISANSLTKTLRRLADDDSVKAVVLRIDSPGGSALASDLLWHELTRIREKKPLVASVGSMAASGGYYMACAAQEIYAESSSIVGSIGVVGGKFAINQALSEHGIDSVIVSARPGPAAQARAAYLSAFEPWDEPTRERMRETMQGIYELFLKRVAAGRKMSVAEVEPHAQGRIWSGQQGHERKLVDHLGGLRDAVERARVLAGLSESTPVVLEGGRESFLEILGGNEEASIEQMTEVAERHLREREQWLTRLAAPLLPQLQAFAPVLDGERVLAASPYLLVVQ